MTKEEFLAGTRFKLIPNNFIFSYKDGVVSRHMIYKKDEVIMVASLVEYNNVACQLYHELFGFKEFFFVDLIRAA